MLTFPNRWHLQVLKNILKVAKRIKQNKKEPDDPRYDRKNR